MEQGIVGLQFGIRGGKAALRTKVRDIGAIDLLCEMEQGAVLATKLLGGVRLVRLRSMGRNVGSVQVQADQ